MFELSTGRLRLIPLDIDQLKLFLDDRPALESSLGLNLSTERLWQALRDRFSYQHKAMVASPDWKKTYLWNTLWLIVQKEGNRIIGGTHFHGAPDAAMRVEIGLFVWDDFRSKGYGPETTRRMVEYALRDTEAETVVAWIKRSNAHHQHSRRSAEKSGMVPDRETELSVSFTATRDTIGPAAGPSTTESSS